MNSLSNNPKQLIALALVLLTSLVALLGRSGGRPVPSAFTAKAHAANLTGQPPSRSTLTELAQPTEVRRSTARQAGAMDQSLADASREPAKERYLPHLDPRQAWRTTAVSTVEAGRRNQAWVKEISRPDAENMERLEAGTLSSVATLVKDINTGTEGSLPSLLTNVNGTLFFRVIQDDLNGQELWKSDGTAAGTVLVQDINPGSASSGPGNLTNVNGTLFFVANDGVNGVELWKSDGTAAGTVLVKDINPGSGSAFPGFPPNLTNVNGTLFFTAVDPTNGFELWKSDGTVAGTVLVKDIMPGNANSNATSLTNVNGTLFFTVATPVTGTELWKSDGMAVGTVLVRDINPGSGSSNPVNLTNVNGTLFFIAFDPVNGNALWKSDGTAAGTVLVKDIEPGSGGSILQNLTNLNGVLFFVAFEPTSGVELWKSGDGGWHCLS